MADKARRTPHGATRYSLGLVLAGSLALLAGTPAAAKWRLVGKTYNSVAFLDLDFASPGATGKVVRVMRVSGQPAKDRWRAVDQKIAVNCATRGFTDGGSAIEQSNGAVVRYPGSPAMQRAGTRGIFADLYAVVCEGRAGLIVADPKAWTARHFRVGE